VDRCRARHESPCGVAVLNTPLNLLRDPLNPGFQRLEVVPKIRQESAHRGGEFVFLVAQHPGKIDPKDPGASPNGDAELQKKPSNLVDQAGSLTHVTDADTMQSLTSTLLRLPDLDEAHGGRVTASAMASASTMGHRVRIIPALARRRISNSTRHGPVMPGSIHHELCAIEGVENLFLQTFLQQLAVDALAIPVLPGTARIVLQRFGSYPGQPVPQCLGHKLRAVIRSVVLRDAMHQHHLRQGLDHVVAVQPSPPRIARHSRACTRRAAPAAVGFCHHGCSN